MTPTKPSLASLPSAELARIRKGARVEVSGNGRTARWGGYVGTVTRRRGAHVFVVWDRCAVEDEMKLDELRAAAQ